MTKFEIDETAFLLKNPANRQRLLKAIDNVRNRNNLVELSWDKICPEERFNN